MFDKTFCLFLRINTHNTLFSDTCVSLLTEGYNTLVVKEPEAQHYPDAFKVKPTYNSGDMLMFGGTKFYQENPSKNRVLRAFADEETAGVVFSAFNQINMNQDSRVSKDITKPEFSAVIRDRFIPTIDNAGVPSFMFVAETKNPQVILYGKTPFNWLAIHDDYTYLLIATQKSVEQVQELLMPHLPGAYVFCMAVSRPHVAFHPIFLCQKYRRLERSVKDQGASQSGRLRALAGVESYLDRLSLD